MTSFAIIELRAHDRKKSVKNKLEKINRIIILVDCNNEKTMHNKFIQSSDKQISSRVENKKNTHARLIEICSTYIYMYTDKCSI